MYKMLLIILLLIVRIPDVSAQCFYFPKKINCDFENEFSGTFQNNSEYKIGNSKTQTNEHAFEGKFGLKLDSNNIYGGTIKLKAKAGDILKIKIKRLIKSQSSLVLSISGGTYTSVNKGKKINDKWEELEINSTVYSKQDDPIATIYVFYDKHDKKPAYFDQLEIKVFGRDDTIAHPSINNSISINIQPNDFKKIKESREKAFKTGIIEDKLKFWIPVVVDFKGDTIKGKYRIKGDWTEHLETDKWGAKLKLNSPIFKNKKFSIMKPNSRSGLREILFHEILKDNEILTTNYKLEGVVINGNSKGYFAIEEHFSKRYLKIRGLPIGPILKIDENNLWKARIKNYYSDMWEKSKIIYYLTEKIQNYVKTNKKDEDRATRLLNNFRKGSSQLDSIFDINYLSTFYALANSYGAHHCLVWHNMRFYYNPETGKLYPIGYDAYSHENYMIRYGYIGDQLEDFKQGWNSLFLNDSIFIKSYKEKLKMFSSKEFIERSIKRHETKLNIALDKINQEDCSYQEDFKFIYKNTSEIRSKLNKERIPISKSKVIIFISLLCAAGLILKYLLPIRKNQRH
jgi:hypothetical protein